MSLPPVPSLRHRAAVRDAILRDRLDTIAPAVMASAGIDAWLIIGREYNEDPVLTTMLPADWLSARRTTMLLFLEGGRRRLAISRYDVGDLFEGIWTDDASDDPWSALVAVLADADPQRIAIDRSELSGHVDGLSATHHEELRHALPERLVDRLVTAEEVATDWLQTRCPSELECYPEVCRIAHAVIAEGLSATTVRPGETTTDDLAWWFRQTTLDLGLEAWFHPTVDVQRHGGTAPADFSSRAAADTIEPGDLVHVDFGLRLYGLHTDMQQLAYVLRPGESGPPPGLEEGLATANRLQDLLTAEFRTGRTGDEVLSAASTAAAATGIDARIYSHPIGLHGHGAGPAIGQWDRQDSVPLTGALPLQPNTAYAIELAATAPVPEWEDQGVTFMLEENAVFDGTTVEYVDGRQTQLHVIG